MKYIEFRVYLKDDHDYEEVAEEIKDHLYEYDEELNPIEDITYEIVEK